MRKRIPPVVMEQRRRERLYRLTFYMSEKTPPNARFILSRAETLNLLQGFFDNSKWRTVAFVLKDAALSQWRELRMNCWFWWQLRVRGRTWKQIDDLHEAEE